MQLNERLIQTAGQLQLVLDQLGQVVKGLAFAAADEAAEEVGVLRVLGGDVLLQLDPVPQQSDLRLQLSLLILQEGDLGLLLLDAQGADAAAANRGSFTRWIEALKNGAL